MVFLFVYAIFAPANMKRLLLTILITIAFTAGMTGAKRNDVDTLVMNRLFSYLEAYQYDLDGFTTNVYSKHLYQVEKRNVGLLAIPSMYSISHGERTFVSEEYSRFTFKDIDEYDNRWQVYCTTIPRNRRTMGVLFKYLTPSFYNVTIYKDHILSPFCKENSRYYQYRTVPLANHQVRLYFRPRLVKNTQLVRGKAILDERTGRLKQVEMEGEFDKQGRINISPTLKEHAGLKKECVIVGVSTRIEIWAKERWDDYSEEANESYDDIAESLDDIEL